MKQSITIFLPSNFLFYLDQLEMFWFRNSINFPLPCNLFSFSKSLNTSRRLNVVSVLFSSLFGFLSIHPSIPAIFKRLSSQISTIYDFIENYLLLSSFLNVFHFNFTFLIYISCTRTNTCTCNKISLALITSPLSHNIFYSFLNLTTISSIVRTQDT